MLPHASDSTPGMSCIGLSSTGRPNPMMSNSTLALS